MDSHLHSGLFPAELWASMMMTLNLSCRYGWILGSSQSIAVVVLVWEPSLPGTEAATEDVLLWTSFLTRPLAPQSSPSRSPVRYPTGPAPQQSPPPFAPC